MSTNCPECGKFMKLVPFDEVGKNVWDSFLWWWCDDKEERHFYEIEAIPAPEYQWLWNCEGIPAEDLIDRPKLMKEYTEMWNRLPKTIKHQYVQQAPDKIIQSVAPAQSGSTAKAIHL